VEVFADPFSNRGIGIFRFDLADSLQKKLVAVVQSSYNKGLMFDMKFDLATDDRMYCAEFVYKSPGEGKQWNLAIPAQPHQRI
jgi:hypothetical protein